MPTPTLALHCPACGELLVWDGDAFIAVDHSHQVCPRNDQDHGELLLNTLCEVMHDAYETAAIDAGWQTQERLRVPWSQVPQANKDTMFAATTALVQALVQL